MHYPTFNWQETSDPHAHPVNLRMAEWLMFPQADFSPSSSPFAHGLQARSFPSWNCPPQLPNRQPFSPSADWHKAVLVLGFGLRSGWRRGTTSQLSTKQLNAGHLVLNPISCFLSCHTPLRSQISDIFLGSTPHPCLKCLFSHSHL